MQLREVDLTEAEVGARIDRAPVGNRSGPRQQLLGLALAKPAIRQISSAMSAISLPDLR